MDIQGPVVVTYVYRLVEGEVRVEKVEYRKDADAFTQREAAPRSTALPQAIPGTGQTQSVW
jgi:vacuolar protein sorting-associated protein 29